MYKPTVKTRAKISPVSRGDLSGCGMATDLRIEYYSLCGDQLRHVAGSASGKYFVSSGRKKERTSRVWHTRILFRFTSSSLKRFDSPRSTWWAGRESNSNLRLRTTPCLSFTPPALGTRAGNPTRISSLGPKRHHALDHASLINVEGMQRIEL